MSSAETIRAWKDPQYRATLTVAPPHPAGQIEFADPALGGSRAENRGFRAETSGDAGSIFICGHTKLLTKNNCCK